MEWSLKLPLNFSPLIYYYCILIATTRLNDKNSINGSPGKRREIRVHTVRAIPKKEILLQLPTVITSLIERFIRKRILYVIRYYTCNHTFTVDTNIHCSLYVLLSELLYICCLRRKLYISLPCNIPTLSVFNQRIFSLDVRYWWSARLSSVKTRMGLFCNIKQLRLMCFATSLQLIRFPCTPRSKVERQHKYSWRFIRYFSLSRRDCKYRKRRSLMNS